jgi:hypothetical protein
MRAHAPAVGITRLVHYSQDLARVALAERPERWRHTTGPPCQAELRQAVY